MRNADAGSDANEMRKDLRGLKRKGIIYESYIYHNNEIAFTLGSDGIWNLGGSANLIWLNCIDYGNIEKAFGEANKIIGD